MAADDGDPAGETPEARIGSIDTSVPDAARVAAKLLTRGPAFGSAKRSKAALSPP